MSTFSFGKYKVTWTFDPFKVTTYCTIRDENDQVLTRVHAQLHRTRGYNKVKARTVSFKKAIKELAEAKKIPLKDIEELKAKFQILPNKGVI